jgi:hypothetical protein
MLKLEIFRHNNFKINPAFLVAFIMPVITAFPAVSADGDMSSRPASGSANGTQTQIMEWLPLVRHNGLVVGIGHLRFPVAVRLPGHVHLATRYGLLLSGGDMRPGHFNVRIFFDTRDEAKIRQWIHDLPRDLPLDETQVCYSIIQPTPFNVRFHGAPGAKVWNYSLVVRAGKSKIEYSWFGSDNIFKNKAPETNETDEVNLFRIYGGVQSPVREQTRLISLMVLY